MDINSKQDLSEKKSILDEVMQSREDDMLREFNPYEVVSALLKNLGKRESHILTKRFNLDGQSAKTLEEIGKIYGVTRERVRQIEASALRELREQEFAKMIEDPSRAISAILENGGGIMEENYLLRELLSEKELSPINKHSTLFIMKLSPDFDEFEETNEINKSWGVKGASLETALAVINSFVGVLENHNNPIHHDLVIEHIKKHPSFNSISADINDDHVHIHLEISKKLKKNPFSEWGLSHWSTISPKGVKDKAFLVLKKHQKPLHFRDIAKHIDKASFDSKKAHPQTVHNELIKDSRFVLVGRGLYALKEWGYKAGTVADVIERAMKNTGKPMTKEEIIREVLKERLVKNNTIVLGLQGNKRFKRLEDGKFTLA